MHRVQINRNGTSTCVSMRIRGFCTVLWIRIRSDPKLFAGSGYGSGIIDFGSGSDKLQFSLTKIACNLLSR